MFVDANPMPAVTAKTNVISQTTQPTSAMARCPACHRPAAQDGMTRATRSAATPVARKSQPAASLEPKERANQPFIVTPAAAGAKAAVDRTIGATWRCDVTAGAVKERTVSRFS